MWVCFFFSWYHHDIYYKYTKVTCSEKSFLNILSSWCKCTPWKIWNNEWMHSVVSSAYMCFLFLLYVGVIDELCAILLHSLRVQYRMPEAYDQDGVVNQEKRFSVALQRYRWVYTGKKGGRDVYNHHIHHTRTHVYTIHISFESFLWHNWLMNLFSGNSSCSVLLTF